MMKANDGFLYVFNVQVVVEEGAEVVFVAELTQRATDVGELFNTLEATTASLVAVGTTDPPRVVPADADYCSKDNPKPQPPTTPTSSSGRPQPHAPIQVPRQEQLVPNSRTHGRENPSGVSVDRSTR
jgi:hypothetical protein